MRWISLGISYELSGKDLRDSVILSSRICRCLGHTPPTQMTYELFLDKDGKKISKSKGNGLSIEEWLHYGIPASIACFLFATPERSKRLFLEQIPKSSYELTHRLQKRHPEPHDPAWFLNPHHNYLPFSYSSTVNLASALNTKNPDILWSFLKRAYPDLNENNKKFAYETTQKAMLYYQETLHKKKHYREPDDTERSALKKLAEPLKHGTDHNEAALQSISFSVEKEFFGKENLRQWFSALYRILLGQESGPRFGVFIHLYGVQETIALIKSKIK